MFEDFEHVVAEWAHRTRLVEVAFIVGSRASDHFSNDPSSDLDLVLLLKSPVSYSTLARAARTLQNQLKNFGLLPSSVVLAPGPEWTTVSRRQGIGILHLIVHTSAAFEVYMRFPDRALLGWSLENRLLDGPNPFSTGPFDPKIVEHIYGDAGLRHLRSTITDLVLAEQLCPLPGSARIVRRWARSLLRIPFPVELRSNHRSALGKLCVALNGKNSQNTREHIPDGLRLLWRIADDLESRLRPQESTQRIRGDLSW